MNSARRGKARKDIHRALTIYCSNIEIKLLPPSPVEMYSIWYIVFLAVVKSTNPLTQR